MHVTRTLLLFFCFAGPLAWASPSAQATQPSEDPQPLHDGSERDLGALIERVLPSHGSIIAVFEPVEQDRFARTTVGYDAASGAWFMATWQGYRGRDPSGSAFQGEAGSLTPRVETSEENRPPVPLADYMPFVLLRYLREEPERIRSVERNADLSWLVTFSMPGPSDRPPWILELGPDGVPIRLFQDDSSDRRETRYEYHAESPQGFPVVAARSVEARSGPYSRPLSHIEFFPEGNSSLFESSSVAAVCVDNRAIVDMRRQASIAGFTRNEDGAWTPPDRTNVKPYSGDDLRAYRWPLVLAGLTLVALAGYEIVRRRRGA